jgi:succinate dehydrogenase / fumarate reductase flavoprotein subunit
MRHTMAYKVPGGGSETTGGAYRATDLLSDVRLDYKPVVQTRYEPMERKY